MNDKAEVYLHFKWIYLTQLCVDFFVVEIYVYFGGG